MKLRHFNPNRWLGSPYGDVAGIPNKFARRTVLVTLGPLVFGVLMPLLCVASGVVAGVAEGIGDARYMFRWAYHGFGSFLRGIWDGD